MYNEICPLLRNAKTLYAMPENPWGVLFSHLILYAKR